jgi:hypothetical protein
MVRAACHCTAVRFELAEHPAWVLDCNCTICRRYGALWSYYRGADAAKLLRTPDAETTDSYLWGDKSIAFHRCKTCGCVTHLAAADVADPRVFGINARLVPTLDPSRTRVVQIDNSHSGFFWTKASDAPLASRHPVMPKPRPEDWR